MKNHFLAKIGAKFVINNYDRIDTFIYAYFANLPQKIGKNALKLL